MSSSDLINIFIPILFNGIILFIFQKVMENKFNKMAYTSQLKKNIYQEYFKKLHAIYSYMYIDMETEYFLEPLSKESGVYDDSELQEHMQHVTLLCKELNVHYQTFKYLLDKKKKMRDLHNELMDLFESYDSAEDFIDIYNNIRPICKCFKR